LGGWHRQQVNGCHPASVRVRARRSLHENAVSLPAYRWTQRRQRLTRSSQQRQGILGCREHADDVIAWQ